MKEKPLLFSAPMVRALLEGRKTQTRRTVKPQPFHGEIVKGILEDEGAVCPCPYEVGMRIWVKETWRPIGPWECRGDGATIQYRADMSFQRKLGWPKDYRIKTSDKKGAWTPSIFMGRWASRITLEITAVRVERVQDISDSDAISEGIKRSAGGAWMDYSECVGNFAPIPSYASLWESINGKGSWAKNPWVWCLSFRKL